MRILKYNELEKRALRAFPLLSCANCKFSVASYDLYICLKNGKSITYSISVMRYTYYEKEGIISPIFDLAKTKTDFYMKKSTRVHLYIKCNEIHLIFRNEIRPFSAVSVHLYTKCNELSPNYFILGSP